jgi:hypothetical protein
VRLLALPYILQVVQWPVPTAGDLAVRRVLPVQEKHPQPPYKHLRRRPGVFYLDLKHRHRLMSILSMLVQSLYFAWGNNGFLVCTIERHKFTSRTREKNAWCYDCLMKLRVCTINHRARDNEGRLTHFAMGDLGPSSSHTTTI